MTLADQLRHNTLITPEPTPNPAETPHLHAAAANLLTLGVIIDPENLRGASLEYLTHLLQAAKTLRGDDRTWNPLFPNFPDGVRNTPDLVLVIEQITHYLTRGQYKPPAAPEPPRTPLPVEEMLEGATPVQTVTIETACEKVQHDILAPTALPATYVGLAEDVVHRATNEQRNRLLHACSQAQFKENLSILHTAYVLAARRESTDTVHQTVLQILPTVRNADVLLRILLTAYVYTTATSENLETLEAIQRLNRPPRGTKTAPIPRPIRRGVVSRLDHMSPNPMFPADPYCAHKALWKRFLSTIHVHELCRTNKQRYIADVVFQNVPYTTFFGLIDQGLKGNHTEEAITTAATCAPGVLLRHVVAFAERNYTHTLNELRRGLNDTRVPLPTQISAINALRGSTRKNTVLVNVGGRLQERDTDARLSNEEAAALEDVILQSASRVLAAAPAPQNPVGVKGGDVRMPLSSATRSNTVTDREPLISGQRVPMDYQGKTLRMFTHWYDADTYREDIDLGLVLLDEYFTPIVAYSFDSVYYGEKEAGVVFSGDVVAAPRPDGAVEFFDVDTTKLLAKYPDARYLVTGNEAFRGRNTFDKIDHFSGVMIRNEADKGEVFDPRTVRVGSTLGAKSFVALPFAFDLARGEMVWLDADTGLEKRYSSISENTEVISRVVSGVLGHEAFEARELLELWASVHNVSTDPDLPVDLRQAVGLL